MCFGQPCYALSLWSKMREVMLNERSRNRQVRAVAPWLLLVASVAPYVGTWSHGFINYDDDSTICDLSLIRRLDLPTLREIFRPQIHPNLPEYMPLKNLSYAVDYALFGLHAPGFRVQQQCWYVVSVVLF